MKRMFCLVLLLVLLTLNLFAAKQTKTAVIELQGAYDSALNMSIEPIAAQSESYLAGMPFNIEEEFVQYRANSDGRIVARWNVLSNTKFNIYMKLDNMVHATLTGDNYAPDTPLSYILTFSYTLAYPNLSEDDYASSGSFYMTSGNDVNVISYGSSSATTDVQRVNISYAGNQSGTFYRVNLFDGDQFTDISQGSGFAGSVDGYVSFKFTSAATEALSQKASQYKVGNYTALVTFFVEAQ